MKYLKIGYIITLLGLFFYSFTQVDLNLTLSQISIWQNAQKFFQQIGFFNRPLSALIFSIILILLFLFYFTFLLLAYKKKMSIEQVWFLIVSAMVILTFSYNAFSYDLFNYMFDAKIITIYGQNPFVHSPSDFFQDPWLNFMRWTHRTYPYGPVWLLLTVPLSFIGFGYFLPTFFLYKILMAASFFGCCYLIYKISQKIFPGNTLVNLVSWSLNPLVLIEGLVSAHNDIPMAFFTLLFFYWFIKSKYIKSGFAYLLSIGVKYATLVLIPVVLLISYLKIRRRYINWGKIFVGCFFLSIIAIIFATIRTTFQPWYLLYILPFAALVFKKLYISIPTIIATIFGTVIYIPYVLLTDYAKEYPSIIQNIAIIGLVTTVITFFIFAAVKKLRYLN